MFFLYGNMSIDQSNYLNKKAAADSVGIFKGNMIVCLLGVITLIFLERYMNRTDTKAEKKSNSL